MNQLFLFRKNMTPIRKLLLMKMFAGGVPISEYTATGNPLTFNTNVAKPLKSLTIPWTPVQSGTGDPSPENVRSISGVSGVNVWQTGKNLFDGEYPEIVPAPLYYRAIYVGNETVTVSSDIVKTGTSSYSNLFALAGNVSTGAATGINDVREGVSRTITPINGYITLAYRSFEDVDPRDYHTQIEVGSTATPYTPYTGTTKSIVFPDEVGTVYGGSLDVVSGVLTVEWAGFRKTWGDGGSATDMGSDITRKVYPMVDYLTTGSSNNMCNIAPYGSNENADIHFYYSGSGSTNRNCRLFLPSDTPDSTEITVITKLSQTYTIQLTPTQVNALLGDNVIWSDTNGTNTAVYLKKG